MNLLTSPTHYSLSSQVPLKVNRPEIEMGDWKWRFLATLITVLLPLVFYLLIPHSPPPHTAAPETPIVLPAAVKTPARCRRCPQHAHPTLPSPTIKTPTLPAASLPPLTSKPTATIEVPPTPTPPVMLNPPPSLPTLPPPSPPSPGTAPSVQGTTCPIDTLKLNGCVDQLARRVHVGNGGSAKEKCCPVLQGLVGLDAAVCLCTTIKAKRLSITIVLPIALEILVQCGNTPPPGFTCQ